MSSPIFANEVDLAKLSIGTLKAMDSGARMAYVLYDGQPLRVQTPVMPAPFGVSRFSPAHKASLSLSFADMAGNVKVQQLHDMLQAFDAKVLDIAHERSVELFKTQKSPEQLEDRYTKAVRVSKDSTKYADTFKVSVPEVDSKFVVCTMDQEGKTVDLNDVHSQLKNARLTAIASPTVLWSAGNGTFGVSWKLVALKTPTAAVQESLGFR